MYEAPAGAREAFWSGLRVHMREAGFDPEPTLAAPSNLDAHWRDPNLLLSQTCGYPLMHALVGAVTYVATPVYRAPGCDGPFYSSVVIVRADERATDVDALRGRRVAFNSRDSQSGYNSLRALIAPIAKGGTFFAGTLETGAHRLSAEAVRNWEADVAAIDAVTWALLLRDEPERVAGLRVLRFTAPAPSLPLVTVAGAQSEVLRRLRASLVAASHDPTLASARAALLLDGFEVLPLQAYAVIPEMRRSAEIAGYPELA